MSAPGYLCYDHRNENEEGEIEEIVEEEYNVWMYGSQTTDSMERAVDKLSQGLMNDCDEYFIRMFLSQIRGDLSLPRLNDCLVKETGELSESTEAGLISRMRVYAHTLSIYDILQMFLPEGEYEETKDRSDERPDRKEKTD